VFTFKILIWVAALIYINMIYARGLWACNKQDVYLKIVSMQAAVNILLNFILIPIYGIVGAAISTVLAELLGFFFYYWQFNKVVYVPIHDYILRPLFATVIMTLFLKSGLNLNIFFLLPGGMLIYGVFLYLIKGITINDVRLVYGRDK
ncbi:MAG: polysaccharide biosynthesis C-terminal domain-containing protein, partial [Nitrospinae bacterium]|nr:polysaccharide biosynthesis C-terminal domain-containing protein [Nitrospinota bacterium]